MKRRILYKFCALDPKNAKYVRQMIVERELYFSDPSKYNDPYDCKIGRHLRSHLEPFGVLSLSTEGCDMILMFSHYANRHRGLCLQFEIDEDGTLNEIAPFNGKDIDYKDVVPPFCNANEAHMTLLTKYRNWEYEKEYRVLMVVKSESDRIRRYERGQLKGAIFGLYMEPKYEKLVKKWFIQGEHAGAFFKKAKLAEDGFGIDFVDI